MTRGFANELHAAAHLEFRQQGRNVEFDGTFREIEIGSDLFIGEAIRNAGKNFLLAARQTDLTVDRLTSFEQLVSFLNQVFQNFVFGLNQNGVITGTLPSNKAVHGKQSGRLIYGKTAVRAGLYMKVGYSRVLFVKEEGIAVGYGPGSQQLMRMVTFMDYLHVHPPQNAAS